MHLLLLLARCRSWSTVNALILFALPASLLLTLSTPQPAQAQYPGGGYPGSGSGGGYPGGGSGGGSTNGHCWQIVYTQTGSWSYADRDMPVTGQSTGFTGAWPTTGNGYEIGGGGQIDGNVSGTITATLTWIPAAGQTLTSDPPPQQLNIVEYGYAWCATDWGGPNMPDPSSAVADDGLTDSPVSSSNGYTRWTSTSEGYHLIQKDARSGTVTVTCSPSASNPPSSWLPYPNYTSYHYWDWAEGLSSVSFSVYPVTVDVGGPTPTGSGLQLLTGQSVSASLGVPSPFSVDATTYQWSATGDVFYTYNEHAPSHQLILLSDDPSYTTGPAFGCYDKKDKNKITITCSATIVCPATVAAPDGTRLPVTASPPDITSVKPTGSWQTNRGVFGLGFFSNSTSMGANELWNPITITVPQPFSGGTGCLAQLITPVRRLTRDALNGQPNNYYFKIPYQNPDGTTTMVLPGRGLDGAFPYPAGFLNGAPVTPDGGYTWDVSTSGTSGDSPTMAFSTTPQDNGGSAWTKAYGNDIFTTYLMYRPGGGVWVPIQRLDWGWSGNADNSLGYWSATGSDFMAPNGSNTDDPPQWDVVIEANDQLYP